MISEQNTNTVTRLKQIDALILYLMMHSRKKMHIPNRNICKVYAARTKCMGKKHHLTCFMVTLIIFFFLK